MKELVIFDLDGTLLNTIDDLGIATNYALKRWDFPSIRCRLILPWWETELKNCFAGLFRRGLTMKTL